MAHSSDSEYHGISYPTDAFELPSPTIATGASYELSAPGFYHTELPTLPEPAEGGDDEDTP